MADYDAMFKILIIGNESTGKSSMLLKYADDTFPETYMTTIGVDFKINTCAIADKLIKLQIWDTAGQERFRTITSSYYKGAHAIMIVFDITESTSFTNIDFWVSEVKKYASDNVKMFLVGTKCDLIDKRQVSYEEATETAKKYQLNYYEVSAKTGSNIQDTFKSITNELVNSFSNAFTQKPEKKKETVEITPYQEALSQLKAKCC